MITTKGVLRKIEKGLQHDKQANYNLLLTFKIKLNALYIQTQGWAQVMVLKLDAKR